LIRAFAAQGCVNEAILLEYRHAAYLETLPAKVQLPVMSEPLITHYLREIRAKSQKIAEAMRRESTHA